MIKSQSICSERILNNRGKQPYFKSVPSFIFYLQCVMTLPLQKHKIEKGKQQQYRKKEEKVEGGRGGENLQKQRFWNANQKSGCKPGPGLTHESFQHPGG